jgi:tRNA pseudouridine38-40 synthase
MRYFFRAEYDGTRYGGWQSQTNAPSVQAALDRAFTTITRQPCTVVGAGRTDAGVHARAQGAHVDIDAALNVDKCELSVNAVLPYDISIYRLQPAAPDFHARYSAVRRRYRYYMADRKRPLLYKKVWMLFHKVDWDKVQGALPPLLGKRDFGAFCASGSSAKTMTCTVLRAELSDTSDGRVFVIEADRFLYKMVRTIVGTLIDIGRGKITQPLKEIIAKGDRKLAGETAPACGLVLDNVVYDGID